MRITLKLSPRPTGKGIEVHKVPSRCNYLWNLLLFLNP
nr:MAG TPA: hypothetical protein [Bacteriophage sp.]